MAGKALLEQGVTRRKAILKFLRSYIKEHGFAPTIQEIADAVALVSPNATRNHLRKLAEEGYITMQPRIARAIALVDPAPDAKLVKQRAPRKVADKVTEKIPA